MAVVTTNLGVVTAYGDAVAAGYTGTKAEWQELMASYATVAEEAAQSATDAETAKNAAITAKTAAETAKTDAIAAKTAAQTAQGAAEDAAQDAEDSAESIAASASQIAQNTSDISDLKEYLNVIESGIDFTSFVSASTYNANYYSGGVKEWGTAKRVINTSTLTYPCQVKLTCDDGYTFNVEELIEAHTFTGNEKVATTKTSGYVTEYVCDADSNILIVLKKGTGTTIATTEWSALHIEMYPYKDITTLTEMVDAVTPPVYQYRINGQSLDMNAQGYNASRLPFNPPAVDGATQQGMAYYGGVIFQCYSNGICKLVSLSDGTVITTFTLDSGHSASASFSSLFYDGDDEFPMFYISDHKLLQVYEYRISRTEFTLLKTYQLDFTDVGYYTAACINKQDNTLWTIGYVENSYSTGTGMILAHFDLTGATESDGVYSPVLLKKITLPWKRYMQFIQCCNNQLFVGFGSDLTTDPEITSTQFWIFDCGTMVIKTILKDFPANLSEAEIEGCDFILADNYKYDMITAQRSQAAYWRIKFE